MNRQEFEHIIKACANATDCHEFLIIGSQSILASVPDAPRELRISMELDVCPLPFTESAAAKCNRHHPNPKVDLCNSCVLRSLTDRNLRMFLGLTDWESSPPAHAPLARAWLITAE